MAIRKKIQPMAAQSTQFRLSDTSQRLCPICLNKFTRKTACDECQHGFNDAIKNTPLKHSTINGKEC